MWSCNCCISSRSINSFESSSKIWKSYDKPASQALAFHAHLPSRRKSSLSQALTFPAEMPPLKRMLLNFCLNIALSTVFGFNIALILGIAISARDSLRQDRSFQKGL
eukprot:SAG31_NODE_3429_length_4284_cov_7.544086_6_plen_107_part_00